VSTAKQGKRGRGREAQEAAVQAYLNGGRWKLTAEFTEVGSGRRSDRPQLAAALAACILHRAKLVVAKVDRLTRSVAFLSALLESGARCCSAICRRWKVPRPVHAAADGRRR
jgi:DNA invertase Pin-like site-specific DNA recombinase